MNILGYEAVVEPLAERLGGGFVGYIPALKGCISDGDTPEEAARNLADAARGWVETAKKVGQNVPRPTLVGQRIYA